MGVARVMLLSARPMAVVKENRLMLERTILVYLFKCVGPPRKKTRAAILITNAILFASYMLGNHNARQHTDVLAEIVLESSILPVSRCFKR